jgi:hypothetical protein
MKRKPGEYSPAYLQWVKDERIKGLTGNQVDFAHFALDNLDKFRMNGNLLLVFMKIRHGERYKRGTLYMTLLKIKAKLLSLIRKARP